MATYQIFITDKEVEYTQLGMNSFYSYRDGFLCIFNKEKLLYCLEPKKGDAFVVICDKGKVVLKDMVPPKRRGALVAWLLRFNKDNRSSSLEEYKRKLCAQRKRRHWEGYKEKEFISDTYMFTLCNSPMDANYRNVACFISDAITKNEVLGLIPLMQHHPDWYMQEILFNAFNISESEFRKAKAKTFIPL